MKSGCVAFFFKESTLRKKALETNGTAAFSLYGGVELYHQGKPVCLCAGENSSGWVRWVAGILRRYGDWHTGYGGNPRVIFSAWEVIREARGIVATSNNVGLPLLELKRWGLVRAPILLLSVGLEAYRSDAQSLRCRRLANLLKHAERIVVFSEAEKRFLSQLLNLSADLLTAVPYGFHPRYFPTFVEERTIRNEVLTVGADAQRDMELFREWSLRHPETRIRAILSREIVERLPSVPGSWVLENDIPLETVLARLAEASFVVIPV